MPPTLPPALTCDRVEWLAAEVSARRYARLHRPRGAPTPTAVAMLFPAETSPREVLRVARATELLARAGLPVPTIYGVEAQQGWILQEDLGDETLAAARAAGRPVAEAYSEAVGLLACLVPLTLDTSPRPPLGRERLATELGQFTSLALGLREGPGPALAAEIGSLLELCLRNRMVLCHRDYHARNLLIQAGRVRVVDHQDALPGPQGYDRVSLAYDPYVELPDAIRDRIAGDGEPLAALAVQRLCKAMGTYADHGGAWGRLLAPTARQARRLLDRTGRRMPLLDLGLAAVAAGGATRDAAT